MHPDVHRNSTGLVKMGSVFTILLLAASGTSGGDFPVGVGWQNLEFSTFAPHSIREIANCKVEKVFLDHRKIGFFRVRLLPVLVVQGIRLKFGDPNPTNEWAQSFQSDWLPKTRRSAVEWRDVSIVSQTPGSARLHAGSAQLAAAGAPPICRFQDVTLEANGETCHLPQAGLRNDAGRPVVAWQNGGITRCCDLFSGETTDNPKSTGAEK